MARAAGGLAPWQAFDVCELRPWLGWLSLVDLLHDEQDLRWRVFGTEVATLLQRDLTGLKHSERPELAPDAVVESYWLAGKTAAVVLEEIDVDFGLRPASLFRLLLLLPLTESGTRVDLVMTGYAQRDPAIAILRVAG